MSLIIFIFVLVLLFLTSTQRFHLGEVRLEFVIFLKGFQYNFSIFNLHFCRLSSSITNLPFLHRIPLLRRTYFRWGNSILRHHILSYTCHLHVSSHYGILNELVLLCFFLGLTNFGRWLV